jgi:RNA polymerase-binding protein DksA
MLTTIQLKTLKQTLREQRANLQSFFSRKQDSINTIKISNPDNADRALTFRKNNRKKLLLDHVETRLNEIDLALKRLENGTYGVCSDCGTSIQMERLEIMPTVSLCIDCQKQHDETQ